MSSDLSGLSNRVPVFQGVTREKIEEIRKRNPEIVDAAEQMEALFVDQLFQVMRNSVPESEFGLENHATKIYTSMLDSELAKNAVKAHSLGLSELLVAHLESQRYAQERSSVSQGQQAKQNSNQDSKQKKD